MHTAAALLLVLAVTAVPRMILRYVARPRPADADPSEQVPL